jgi:hypothetical protein
MGGIDPMGLAEGYSNWNIVAIADRIGVNPEFSPTTVNIVVGAGDGSLATLSFGFVQGEGLRNRLGIYNAIDPCSPEYKGGRVAGTALTLAVHAGAAIPKTLTHFTTQAGANGIAQSGLRASSGGLFGGGRYASSIGPFPRNPFVPPGSTIGVPIGNTAGYVRAVPGTFLRQR